MTPPTSAPYGTWKSSIMARLMTEGAVGLGGLKADGDCLYWLESRPSEAGRSVLVCRTPDGAVTDLTPAPFNVGTRAHEYGGGAFGVGNGVVVFANCCSARGLRADRRDKLLKLLDTGGQNCTPNNSRNCRCSSKRRFAASVAAIAKGARPPSPEMTG